MKLDVLVFAVHPDDAELGCSGTILKYTKAGKKVGIVDFTVGELGTRGSGDLRLKEAADSELILGLTARENLGMRDGFFKNDEEHQMRLIPIIRKYRPDIILANAPEDRHPDHGRASKLAFDSCFYSGLRRIKSSFEGMEQEAWRPKALYYYIQDRYIEPDFVVDITEEWEDKLKAVLAFKSQFFNPDSKEPQSYLSTPEFLRFLEGRALEMGHKVQVKYGEGFLRSAALKVKDLFDLH